MLVRFGSRSGAAAALWRRLASQGSPASAASDYTGASAAPPLSAWFWGDVAVEPARQIMARFMGLGHVCMRGGTATRRALEPRAILLLAWAGSASKFMPPYAVDAPRSAVRLPNKDHARTPALMYYLGCRRKLSLHRSHMEQEA